MNERTGILKYDCGLTRSEAEALSWQQVMETRH
jgi:hypothetical protein